MDPDIDPHICRCERCHLTKSNAKNEDWDNYTFGALADYDDKGMIDGDQWTNIGHGVPAGNFLPINNRMLVDGQPPPGAQGPDLQCIDDTIAGADTDGPAGSDEDGIWDGCHTASVPHGDPTNPFKLLGGSDYVTEEPDRVCFRSDAPYYTDCHGGALGLEVDKHDFPGGYQNSVCFDCHDPHGDTSMDDASLPGTSPQGQLGYDIPEANINTSMLQRELIISDRWNFGTYGAPTAAGQLEPAVRYVATDSYTDFIQDPESTIRSSICEVCHLSVTTNYFRQKNDDGQDPATFPDYHKFQEPGMQNCLICHEKPYKPKGCTKCHAGPMGGRPQIVYIDGNGDAHFWDPTDPADIDGDKAHSRHGNDGDGSYITDVECVLCHLEGELIEELPDNPGKFRVDITDIYHPQTANAPIDLRDFSYHRL